jgi:hypothetical protein
MSCLSIFKSFEGCDLEVHSVAWVITFVVPISSFVGLSFIPYSSFLLFCLRVCFDPLGVSGTSLGHVVIAPQHL